jgi:hypothetical protein
VPFLTSQPDANADRWVKTACMRIAITGRELVQLRNERGDLAVNRRAGFELTGVSISLGGVYPNQLYRNPAYRIEGGSYRRNSHFPTDRAHKKHHMTKCGIAKCGVSHLLAAPYPKEKSLRK